MIAVAQFLREAAMQILPMGRDRNVGHAHFLEGECCSLCGKQLRDGALVRVRKLGDEYQVMHEPQCEPQVAAVVSAQANNRAAS